jgi:amino acid transporter
MITNADTCIGAFIGVTHVRFRKAWILQGNSVSDLPYQAFLYPYGTYFVVGLNIFLVVISGYGVFVGGFDAVNFVFNYIVLVIFVALYAFWKVFKRTKWVKLEDMDLQTGRRPYGISEAHVGQSESLKDKAPWWIEAKRWVVG